MIDLPRRGFITGIGLTLIGAPAIVRASSLMAVSPIDEEMVLVPVRRPMPVGAWHSLSQGMPYSRSMVGFVRMSRKQYLRIASLDPAAKQAFLSSI